MGRFCYWMNVSIDGFIESAPGEDGGGSWMRIGRELHEEFNREAEQLTMHVNGRRVFEIMESSWPAMADDDSIDEVLRDYGRIWLAARKVLVSTTRASSPYAERVIGAEGEDVIAELARLRDEEDGTIGVGGATLATHLLAAGLLDELLLCQHPALLGSGRPLFDELAAPLQFELVESATFPGGVIKQRFALT
jgi:dihydrofolate reductase